ncbi:hypothetical protein LO80_01040 [Candidatus Francisella endociliophora]|uniref:Mechanosensitive ion channel MscS domain-containing protein n=1 Tax=Candidatus Francisella endociliophora TaxID=653937 RepID=A0A097ERQ7_9GAMM|nr:mechanosensitive ion channel domain-containing protein [Francisella sp. FSC1006]AIT10250.1 hypothetical protein LO80_01040 [Francisella sp. FSC1006]
MEILKGYYINLIGHSQISLILAFLTIFLIVLLLSLSIGFIINRYILSVVRSIFSKSNILAANLLAENKVFTKLSRIAPAIFIYVAIGVASHPENSWTISIVGFIKLMAQVYITIYLIWFLIALVDAIFNYFQTFSYFKHHSLRSYAQVVKIILFILGFILVVSLLLNKSPIAFLTGLGAMSAVLMLVFKDTILGFVTNIQVAALDLVRVGDWITIPSAGVDGDVMEVSINTVKIRNFDKTISTVPTYTLINNSVQNWRGMVETGGRRIKRSVNIDIDTIRFCEPELLAKLQNEEYLKEFIETKKNQKITNITLFRTYIENYLRNHPQIHLGLTFLIRELQPTETGLPVELYIFTNDTNWVNYEKIQADIFDYVFASLQVFDLKAFQAVTGRITK